MPPPFQRRAQERENRRQHARMVVDTPARMSGGATSFDGKIDNVSATGASFITPTLDPEVAVGSNVVLMAPAPNGGERELRGRVVRSEVLFDVGGEVRTYAVAFDHPTTA